MQVSIKSRFKFSPRGKVSDRFSAKSKDSWLLPQHSRCRVEFGWFVDKLITAN